MYIFWRTRLSGLCHDLLQRDTGDRCLIGLSTQSWPNSHSNTFTSFRTGKSSHRIRVGNFSIVSFFSSKAWASHLTVMQIDEEKHQTVAAMLLNQEDSLGVKGSGDSIVVGSRESVKSLMFFDISKLEAELVQIIKQEEVCTRKAYIDILNLLSWPWSIKMRGHKCMWLEPSCLENVPILVCLLTKNSHFKSCMFFQGLLSFLLHCNDILNNALRSK